MFWESSGVVGFDLGPLIEGQMRTANLKSAYNWLIIGPRGLVHCLYGGYNLHRFSDALGLVILWFILCDFKMCVLFVFLNVCFMCVHVLPLK